MIIIRKTGFLLIFFVILALCIVTGCSKISNKSNGEKKIGNIGVLYRSFLDESAQDKSIVISKEEQKRKETAERLDKAGLLYSSKVVVDSDPQMLIPYESVSKFAGKDYTIAKTPPTVEFAIIPVEPKFFADPPEGNNMGFWSNFSQSIYDTSSGKFYTSVGDHGSYNVRLYFVEYDTEARKVQCLPEIYKLLGRKRSQFSDGKIHGWLDFYRSKHLDRPHLWFCTYWAKYPEPKEEDYTSGYDGGRIMSYDVVSGSVVDYGVPLKRASWPYHKVDTKRGILYAVSKFGEFLVWDINEQTTKWAGFLPKDMGWWVRTIIIDDETGMVYTTNEVQVYLQKHSTVYDKHSRKHFIKYNPYKNRFYKLEAQVPRNSKTGTYDHIGAYTYTNGPDGLYYAVTFSGELLTFDPKKEEVIDKGLAWPGLERYVASMDRSPDGKYVYYIPGAVGSGYLNGSPVIQYNTLNGTKKVLAFMFPYYYEKYGYIPGGTFSIRLDNSGEKLFIVWNGGFTKADGKKGLAMFRHCSVMVVNIPKSERN